MRRDRQALPARADRLDQVAAGEAEALVLSEAGQQHLIVIGGELDVAVELGDVGKVIAPLLQAQVEGARRRRQGESIDPCGAQPTGR